jgi:ribosome maturation protein SDO1
MVGIDKAVIARLKSHGTVFEIMVDCDLALDFKGGKDISIDEILATDKVFFDAKKAMLASETRLEAAFETLDINEIAKKIIKKGEVQITSEHRSNFRDQKRKKIVELIHRNAIDPRTMTPHPVERINLAFDEAKIKIDEHRAAEEQVDGIVKELRPILPIRFEKCKVKIRIPATHAGKAYSAFSGFGKLVEENWMGDGSWSGTIEIPAGLSSDLIDQLNNVTHGEVETEIVKANKE